MRTDALSIFHAALEPVRAGNAVKRAVKLEKGKLRIEDYELDLNVVRNITVIGAGKASSFMSEEIEKILNEMITDGMVITKYGHGAKLKKIEQIEGGHPVPDDNCLRGAERIMEIAGNAGRDDLIICLLSGGGSSLLTYPVEGISLEDIKKMTRILLACGATINEINALRKHISRVKGGQLARTAYPARLISLIISDVVRDRLDVIASGPTVPDDSFFHDCLNIMDKYRIGDLFPPSISEHLEKGAKGEVEETPKRDETFFKSVINRIIAKNIDALKAAEEKAAALGYNTKILSSTVEGESREVARSQSFFCKRVIERKTPIPLPACLISGGETTVKIKGKGKGGRNQEFALSSAIEIRDCENIVVLSAGTDGTDGPTDAAGAIADNNTYERALKSGMDPHKYLAENDSYHFFESLNDLVVTGPTQTNVNDLQIFLVS